MVHTDHVMALVDRITLCVDVPTGATGITGAGQILGVPLEAFAGTDRLSTHARTGKGVWTRIGAAQPLFAARIEDFIVWFARMVDTVALSHIRTVWQQRVIDVRRAAAAHDLTAIVVLHHN